MPTKERAPTGLPSATERFPWHDSLWSILSTSISELPHALLFQGAPGLGKVHFATQLAHMLLCDEPQSGGACGNCHGCRLIQAGTHPDLIAVSPLDDAATITVDQIRALGAFLALRPHTAKHKVVVVTPAEQMNINAANSLLKMLEEPPLGSILLLVSSHPVRLPATIRSRCARLLFRPPARSQAQRWLQPRLANSESSDQFLNLAGGAPLLAEQLAAVQFEGLRLELLQDLSLLSQGKLHPVTCAARWKTLGTGKTLGWLHGVVADKIKDRVGAPSSALLNPEINAKLKDNSKISELYDFIDAIREYYKQLHSPLDELLMLESILIRWVRVSRLH